MPQQAKDINDNVGMESPIYENLPAVITPTTTPKGQPIPELRKYFPREAIYENLCRGCGYGVFAAQGRFCHFCQCIVSGGVVVSPPPDLPLSPIPLESSNIYENICDLCRGIYSDNERCQCQRAETSSPSPAATPTATPTPPPPAKVKASRSLLGYSKSSAATLTRFFGSLKQLNRTSSLQRRIFPRTPTPGGSGSLEIIHNVDEVFRTQETFDLQRICELKSQQAQLKSSQSDQHIYGRVREPEPDSKGKREQRLKKPRVSRMRLLQDEREIKADGSVEASLYLNESICQWMTSLRRQVHYYDEGAWQQPKSVPARESLGSRKEEEVITVTLRRRTVERVEASSEDDEQSLVKDFKRKLQLKREPPEREVREGQQEQEQRRCAITADFVNDYLSALSEEKATQQVALIEERKNLSLPQISLFGLMQSLALGSSLHVCVRGFLTAYDKSLSLWLYLQQQQLQPISYRRRRARDSDSAGEWRLLLFRGGRRRAVSVSPAIPESDDVLSRRAIRIPKRSIQSAILSEGEGVGVGGEVEAGEGVSGVESSTNGSNNNNNNSKKNRALMAAPKPNGEAERPICNNNCSSSSNNNCNNNNCNNNNCNSINNNYSSNSNTCNNNQTNDTENGNSNNNSNTTSCNVSEQQQQEQQQQITQNCVIKVRRPAPKVPVRNPNTSLSNPRQAEEVLAKSNGQNPDQEEEEEEESIYQPIWKFKTMEPADQEIIEALPAEGEDEDEEEEDDEEDEDEEEDLEDYDESLPSDADADVMALQAAAVFAAGVRHKLSTSTLTKRSKMMLPTPLPSPTASMDQGAWETDVEFMFLRESKEEAEAEETLSLGSTVTNSTATMGSISSAGSARLPAPPKDEAVATQLVSLVHPILRNICIFYSQKDPVKYRAIFYDYQRSQIHQRFMTRIRRPAPPPPVPATQLPAPPRNDDSGCSCGAEDQEQEQEQDHLAVPIPQPLKEDWERAVLAAGAVAGKRGVAPRAGRKLRVRSNARLLRADSVLAWRETLQDVYCCEDEEDMIVPVTDILRAQQIQEDNEVQQTQQTTILQRFKSVSIGNLRDLPGEEDKKSIKNRMRMKFAVNSNVFRLNRSPKSEKKSRTRRGQVNSLYLDEQKCPLFAAPLNALELNMTDHPNVPRFVVDVCTYIEQPECIEQDGLYRASGNKVLVDELRKKLTHLYDPRWLHTDDIHTLTSLHKQFFRELAAPLITQEAYERLGRSLTDDAAIERMSLAFDDMPEPNRSTLRFLIRHLTRVAAASASNRMPSTNLAIVWGPCLLSANQIQLDIGRMNMLAKVLIENYDRIFHPDNERLVC
ncbi:uncharacterized protein LOC108042966 [Drosophila rhopaloa]|uniref:Uncharacterized protein LOC108042966 n=1 Tax=Drosophila rhopaloa TaxID=1041015 RepID=A0A6P4EFP7_DRORH|nr:uncharacterized protein LOC108042966 [Drosophila rhopaloa]XP_016976974.1 uncharacterized protein LOC108042966 [Drosophila rhopaloa]XP_016976975.1 uncharacterized protein LOC108042966 [Drosophila rhopaloa]